MSGDQQQSDEWLAGFEAARHQAATLITQLIRELSGSDGLALQAALPILAMTANGTRPD